MSTSFREEDYEFRFHHGRRYQSANDKYHLPNDIVRCRPSQRAPCLAHPLAHSKKWTVLSSST